MSVHSLSTIAPRRIPPSVDVRRLRRASRPVRRIIHNVVTGVTLEVHAVEPDADLLRMRATYPPRSAEPPLHAHPRQRERFEVVAGELIVVVGRLRRVLRAGERLTIEPGAVHAVWNAGDEPAVLHWEMSPALETEELFASLARLAAAGRTDARGVPHPLARAALAWRHRATLRLARPSRSIQRLVLPVLAVIAWLAGER
jgi:quercetin dioxygenase-like cupin family protein